MNRRRFPLRLHYLAIGLIAAHLLLTLAASVLTPLAEAPDEADHWAYVVYLARERSLPVGPQVTQSKHPPFYHVIAALLVSGANPSKDFLNPNPDVFPSEGGDWAPNFFKHTEQEAWPWRDGVLAFHLARLWSVLLSTGTVAVTYALARTLTPRRPFLILAVVGALAFLPEFIFIGGAVNNDNAAAFFGALGLWGGVRIYRDQGRLRAAWWTPLALGFGLLSKVSTAGVWPAVGLALILGAAGAVHRVGESLTLWGRTRRLLKATGLTWRRWLASGALIFGGALLIASPWLLRNRRLYGDFLGLSMARQTIDLRTTPWTLADSAWLLRGWFRSFWGEFGAIGQIAMAEWIYGALAIVSLASVAGLLWHAWRLLAWTKPWPDESDCPDAPACLLTLPALTILALACAGVIVAMWRYSLLALGTDQARLLYPAVAPLVILWVSGLFVWTKRRLDAALAAGLIAGMLTLALYGLFGVLRPAFMATLLLMPSG